MIINTYVPNNKAAKYWVKTDRVEGRNRQLNNNSWQINTALTIMDRTIKISTG